MQAVDLHEIYKDYWDWGFGGLVGTIFFAALVPFVQELAKEKRLKMPSEPFLSISLLLMVFAGAYPVAGLLGEFVIFPFLVSPRPWPLFMIVVVVGVIALALRFFSVRHANTRISVLTAEFGRLQIATDIKSVFDGPDDPTFIESLIRDLERTKSLDITSIGHNCLRENSELWNAIRRFNELGGIVNMVSDQNQHNEIQLNFRRVPEIFSELMNGVFLIDCLGPIYYGIGTDFHGIQISRFDGHTRGKQTISLGLYQLTSQLSRLLGTDHAVKARAITSPAEYKELILSLEGEAKSIDRIPKRLFVVFKSENVIQSIAEQRHGLGSANVRHYIEEHAERSRRFYSALGRGMRCREIYNRSEVIAYVKDRRHGKGVLLTTEQVRDTIVLWRDAVRHQPNYMVGLTDARIPFKYEIIDGTNFIMHEAIGQLDDHRLNAFCITGKDFCERASSDFETIWNSISPQARNRENVMRWIEKELLPLCS
jgi:hypothetical protein